MYQSYNSFGSIVFWSMSTRRETLSLLGFWVIVGIFTMVVCEIFGNFQCTKQSRPSVIGQLGSLFSMRHLQFKGHVLGLSRTLHCVSSRIGEPLLRSFQLAIYAINGDLSLSYSWFSYTLLVVVYEGTVKTTEDNGFWSESLLTLDDPNDRMRYCIGKYQAGELRIIQVHE